MSRSTLLQRRGPLGQPVRTGLERVQLLLMDTGAALAGADLLVALLETRLTTRRTGLPFPCLGLEETGALLEQIAPARGCAQALLDQLEQSRHLVQDVGIAGRQVSAQDLTEVGTDEGRAELKSFLAFDLGKVT
jgi:hypothetical protein